MCDLDNTLWKGEIGEGPIKHFIEPQKTLKELRRKGVLLTVNSKNDARNVHWNGAVLNQDDFVNLQINWDSKVANMRQIQQALNLKFKDFVFIDDRADQRLMVSEAIPEIHVLDPTTPRRGLSFGSGQQPYQSAPRLTGHSNIASGSSERVSLPRQLSLKIQQPSFPSWRFRLKFAMRSPQNSSA